MEYSYSKKTGANSKSLGEEMQQLFSKKQQGPDSVAKMQHKPTTGEGIRHASYVKSDVIGFFVSGGQMKTITSTELARNLRQVLDNLLIDGQEVEIEQTTNVLPA